MKRTWKYVSVALLMLALLLCGYSVYASISYRLSFTQDVDAQGLQTEVTILNDVWDSTLHALRVTGGVGVILTSDSPTVTGIWTFSPTTSLGASGTSAIIGSAQTITLTGVNPTTYSLIDAYRYNSPTLVGTNPGQTVTLGATQTIVGPIKSNNVAATMLTALNIPTWNCSTATTCAGLIITAPTGATTNAAAFLLGNVGIGTSTPAMRLHVAGNLGMVLGPGETYYVRNAADSANCAIAEFNSSSVARLGSFSCAATETKFGSFVSTAAVTFFHAAVERFRLAATTGDFVLGAGEGGTPVTQVLRGPNASGTDIPGVVTTLQASLGTGSGAVGLLKIKASATVLGSGATLQTAVDHMTIGAGAVILNSAAVTPASTGTRYVCIDTTGKLSSSASVCSGT